MMKMLGENDIEAHLERLNRLTREEGVAAGAQTLEGVNHLVVVVEDVHRLVEHTRVAIDGTKSSDMFFDRC